MMNEKGIWSKNEKALRIKILDAEDCVIAVPESLWVGKRANGVPNSTVSLNTMVIFQKNEENLKKIIVTVSDLQHFAD